MDFARTKEDWIRNVLPKAPPLDLQLRFGGTLPSLGEDLLLARGDRRGVLRDGPTLVAGGDIRSLANDGTPERFTDGNRAVVMPTLAALHEFARNCGAEYIYVFEDEAWHSHRF